MDAETVPSIDVTAARMLLALRADLERDGVELVLARDVGQVRDVLEAADEGRRRSRPTAACARPSRRWVTRPG
jgi:anti-anti-sigma regulatory factor